MSQLFTNGSTAFDAATFGKLLVGDTYTNGFYMCIAYRILYDGANWVVGSGYGSEQSIAAVAPVWNAGDNRLDITLTLTRPFTSTPIAIVQALAASAHASDARYIPHAAVTSTTASYVRFLDTSVSVVDYATAVSTKMAFYIIYYGAID